MERLHIQIPPTALQRNSVTRRGRFPPTSTQFLTFFLTKRPNGSSSSQASHTVARALPSLAFTSQQPTTLRPPLAKTFVMAGAEEEVRIERAHVLTIIFTNIGEMTWWQLLGL